MKTKIIEILAKILESLSDNKSLEDVNKKLLQEKEYDEHTIGVAFSLVYDKILFKKESKNDKEELKSAGFRFLTSEEREILGIENYNYLIHLINVGLLDMTQLEAILEQVNFYPESKLTRKDINWMVLLSLVDFDSDIPLGSRFLLFSSDSVN